jgi:subtilase family serine protease/outer membrane protein assembly factor BamB
MMGGPKNRTRNLVAAVLLLVLVATDLFPLLTVSVGALSPDNVPGRDLGPRAGPNFNDPLTNSIGTPAYYAALSNIIGLGTPSGYANDLLSLDIDGDGSLELATMTGQGFIEVLDPPTYKLLWRSSQFNGGVHALAKGDIDGDGLPDLIASDGYGWIYVFSRSNLQDPTAPPMTSARIAPYYYTVRALTVVDFDEDGRSDILCGGMSDYNITHLRNTLAQDGKTVVLAQNKSRTLYHMVETLSVADCYGNGDLEVLVVMIGDYNWLELMTFNKTTLIEQYSYQESGIFEDIEVADIDGNGFNEVVLSDYGRVTILNATNLHYLSSLENNHIRYKGTAVGDYNDDGRVELVVLEYYYEDRESFLGLFNGTSVQLISEHFLGVDYHSVGFLSGDLDNDNGLPELGITTTSNLTLMEPDLAQGYNFTITNITLSVGYETFGLSSLDWNSDGTTELITGSDEALLSVVDPVTGDILAQRDMAPNSQGNVIVADTDLDGQPEFVGGNLANITILNEDLTTQAHKYIGFWGQDWNPAVPAPLAVGDVDHDGLPEVVVGTDASSVAVLNGANLSVEQHVTFYNGMIRSLISADINGDGFPEVITADTLGHIMVLEGPALHIFSDHFYDLEPYGLSVLDQGPGKLAKLLVGNYNGVVRILGLPDLIPLNVSPDLGQEIWGLDHADIDGDGIEEVLAGTGDGKLYALNITDLSVKWVATLGEWIGYYNCILVKDLDKDGHLEVAVGSDGYTYVLRMFTKSEKPDLSLGAIPLMSNREDGQVLEFSVPVTISGPVSELNVTLDLWLEPTGPNVTGGQFLGRVFTTHGLGTFTMTFNWTAIAGDWRLIIDADPDNLLSEKDEFNNRATLDFNVLAKYAQLEWFAGQGTVLGRYQGLVISDTDQDGLPELLVSASEGFVQSYHVGPNKEVSALAMSDDLGTNPFGLVASDVDRDGDTEVVVSNGEGMVYSFKGIGENLEWRSQVTDGPCYSLVAKDIDADGKVEIITGCHDSQLYILNGQDGTLKSHVGLLFELYALDIADFGDEGKLDILAAAQDGTVYIVNAATLKTEASFKLGDAQIDNIKAGDIDHDGRSELVYGDRSGKVYVVGSIQNVTSPLGWSLLFEANLSTGSAVKAVQLVDLTKDTGLELLVASDEGVRAYRSRLGQFELLGNTSVTDSITGMACGDIDKDGAPELVVGTLRGNLTFLGLNATYQGNTTSLSFPVHATLPGLGTGLYGTAYGDIDGDGAPELLLGTESGELRVYDGISKELKLHQTSMGASLYGLKVADVDGDGLMELVTGSGDKQVRVYDYQAGALVTLWSSDKLGDWTIAFDVLDVNLDGQREVVVGAASKVYILNGTTGRTMNSTFDLGSHIISLATGELDDDPWPELVVGTEEGYLPVLNANNLTLAWGAMLDSWPVGLAVADTDGDGLATIYAGTNSAVYALSFKDREILWTVSEGQSIWGLAAADFQSDGEYELFLGLKDGRTLALNVSTGRLIWSSYYLGSRAGWYNSLRVGDTDNDGQKELMIGSSGFLYLFGAGYKTPAPIPDAVLRSVSLQDLELADGQETNISAVIYDHSMAPMVNLTVHLFVDDVFSDSTVLSYLAPLGTQTVSFPYLARAGPHNLTVVIDRYNVIHEYNEANNENTLRVIVLGAMNLGIDGGVKGVRFSASPVKGVEMTVYADIRNSGEEAAGARIKFYWANLRLFGEDTVYVRGQEKVVAAVNWTPPEAGDQDITVVIEPDGFDSNKDDNVATKTVHVLTHPSIKLRPMQLSTEMVEDFEYLIPINITNTGEAQTTGSLAMFVDGNRSWGTGLVIISPGNTQVLAKFKAGPGKHDVKMLLENVAQDDTLEDNELDLNVTVRTRPDLSFDTVAGPKEDQLVIGKTINLALLVTNSGGSNATCTVRTFDNNVMIFELAISVQAGSSKTVQVPWKVTSGDHNLVFQIVGADPQERNTNNNQDHLSLYVPKGTQAQQNLWPQISIMVIVVLAPVVAALFYYAKVQPVRDAAKAAKEARERLKVVKQPLKKKTKGV